MMHVIGRKAINGIVNVHYNQAFKLSIVLGISTYIIWVTGAVVIIMW